jgi:hypothetical protein
MDFKKAYESFRRKILHNILIDLGAHMKLIRQIKMFLNKMYSKVHISKHFTDNFSMQNGLKQGDSVSPVFFSTFHLNMPLGRSKKNSWD